MCVNWAEADKLRCAELKQRQPPVLWLVTMDPVQVASGVLDMEMWRLIGLGTDSVNICLVGVMPPTQINDEKES